VTRHMLCLLVGNPADALARIGLLCAHRRIEIDSISTASRVEDGRAWIFLVLDGDDKLLDQMKKQFNKIVNVIRVLVLPPEHALHRSLMLVKVAAGNAKGTRSVAQLFGAKLLEVAPDTVTLEVTGDDATLNTFLTTIAPLGIVEVIRSGAVCLPHGPQRLAGRPQVRRDHARARRITRQRARVGAPMTSTHDRQPRGLDAAGLTAAHPPTVHRPLELDEHVAQAHKLQTLGGLACGIAHDVNNTLVVINGYSDLIAARVADDKIRADVCEIRRAGERAATLTRQLLGFCRHEESRPRVLTLNDVVRGVESMLRALIGEAVVLETALAPALGSVLADHGQLEQVLVNLAVNARGAMPNGGTLLIETADVRFGAEDVTPLPQMEPGRDYVRLRVRDSGIGMDAQTRERIFEPFFTTKPLGEGTGLGLAIVLGIAEQSGGHLDVTSRPGAGSTFDMYLPTSPAALEPTNEADAAGAGLSPGWETLLIVEDDRDVRAATRRFLEDAGHHVLEAASGGEALDVIERYPGDVHLVITDVVMPGMSGRDLVQRLADLRPRLRTLYISGHADTQLVCRQTAEPDVAQLQKPFTAEALTQKVRDILDGR